MAIYDIFEHIEKHIETDDPKASHVNLNHRFSEFTLNGEGAKTPPDSKSPIFSSIAARLFFFMLLFVDIAWGIFSVFLLLISLVSNLLTGFKIYPFKKFLKKRFLNVKRATVCGISLLVSLFSPALGTMFACTYFLMYDKKGIEEVVPSVLQDQFKEFFTP